MYASILTTAPTRTGTPLSSATLNGHARAIRAWLNWAGQEGIVDDRIPRRVRPPKVEQRLMPVLTPAQVERMLNAADTARDRTIIAVLADTGVRASELCGLTLNHCYIAPGQGAYILVRGKGMKWRECPLGSRAARLLLRYIHSDRIRAANTQPVFTGRGGGSLTPGGLVVHPANLRNQIYATTGTTAIPGERRGWWRLRRPQTKGCWWACQ